MNVDLSAAGRQLSIRARVWSAVLGSAAASALAVAVLAWGSPLLGAAVIGVALAAVIGLAWVLEHTIRGPLQGLAGDLTRVHDDQDLRVRAADAGADEISAVARAVNATLESLEAVVARTSANATALARAARDMGDATGQARGAVSEISATIDHVATGAIEQAASAERVSESVDEMYGGLTAVASVGEAAGDAASSADAAAQEGAETLASARDAMSEITTAVTAATEVVQALGQRSERVGEILNTIQDISSQTNLLALNAAIEAARAGEQGRGFAVVSEEVRKLAEESAEAAGTIAEIISEIQLESRRAVEATERGASAVEIGSERMGRVEEAFATIRGRVGLVSEEAGSITSATTDLRASADRVRDEMSSVVAVSEQNAAAAEEVAASGTETASSVSLVEGVGAQVTASSAELARLVGGFRVSTVEQVDVGGDDLGATIQAALAAHAAWKDRLAAAIEGGEADVTPDQVRPDDACAFGKWLHGPAAEPHRGGSNYQLAHDLHERFHRAAATVLEAALDGDAAKAEKMMAVGSEFQVVSARLAGVLLDWKREDA